MSTTQDHQVAELLLGRPARPGQLVVGDKIKPPLIDGGTRFWYGVSTGAGKRFVLVDPMAGTRGGQQPGQSPARWPRLIPA